MLMVNLKPTFVKVLVVSNHNQACKWSCDCSVTQGGSEKFCDKNFIKFCQWLLILWKRFILVANVS